MKNLVIVESPSKSKTIEKYLGSDYIVKASMGHIRDLATTGKGGYGVDVENNFKPNYIMDKGKTKVVNELKKYAKEADRVYLASDPDREGEAIAWHLKEVLNLKDEDYDAAQVNFEHAARLNPSSKEVEMNMGLISMLNKDWRKANEQLGAAAGVPEANDALGVFYLSQGDLNAANRAFGDTKTNNAALAQILSKDYSSARNTLASISNPDATTYYLMAVLGARTNNENMVITNLRQAIRLDGDLKARAQ